MLVAGRNSSEVTSVFRLGVNDLVAAVQRLGTAFRLSKLEIRKMHSRTILGPYWVTVEQLLFTLGYGLFSSAVFGQDFLERCTYVGLGFVWFSSIAGLVNGSTQLPELVRRVLDASLPMSLAFTAHALRSSLLLGYRLLGVIPFMMLSMISGGTVELSRAALVPVFIAAWLLMAVGVSFLSGVLFIRFRDLGPVSVVGIQVLLFISPVFWRVEDLSQIGRGGTVLASFQDLNPAAWHMAALRASFSVDDWLPKFELVKLIGTSIFVAITGFAFFCVRHKDVRIWA